jgi:hypothetical protein
MIRGTPVRFPFTPYPAQITYMERVLDALKVHSLTPDGSNFECILLSVQTNSFFFTVRNNMRLNIEHRMLWLVT